MKIDLKSNHYKNVLHGFFVSIGTTIAEPATILPIIIHYFGGNSVVIGILSSLLRGGAVVVQLYAAFHAQAYPLMRSYLRRVFLVRFLSWFSIGVAIVLFGEEYHTLTLWLIGIGFFIFSFSAGFGGVYFRELTAKIFSTKFRGYTMSVRQFYAALAAIGTGAAAGWILEHYEAPYSFGYLFMISALLMGFGFLAMGSVIEPVKTNLSVKEKSFKEFLKNSYKILREDKNLQVQVATFLLAYSYLLGLPFIIIDATESIELGGAMIGQVIVAQMVGAMLSNIVWAKMSKNGAYKKITIISISLAIMAFVLSIMASNFYFYLVIFFLLGWAMDGGRISSGNLLIIIAPEDKRPVYSAIQNNITSLGLFFSILGGAILQFFSYDVLYFVTIGVLAISLYLATKLKDSL